MSFIHLLKFGGTICNHAISLQVCNNNDMNPPELLIDSAISSNQSRKKDDKITIPLFIAGTGEVGGTLIEQLEELDHSKYHVQVLGRCNSKTVWWTEGEQSTEWAAILQQLTDHPANNTLFVDATGSDEVARLYPQILEAGIHVVTPSKLANTFEQSFYNQLRETASHHHAVFRYETTVGAGLPVISTINDLQDTGDTITEISGVASGTMTYLFDHLEQGMPFGKAVVQARQESYAEPDPRDDLSGEDVARKFLTLARETGWEIEREELQVQSLIPEELVSVDTDVFLDKLPAYDDYWTRKLEQAHENGMALRYTGRLAEGKITIGIEEVAPESPLGQLRGTDNLFRITTRRYNQTPIIIQGPGAGKEVTAAGVLNDILKVAEAVS